MRKKLFFLILAGLMAFALTGCGSEDSKAVKEALNLVVAPTGVTEDFELDVLQGGVSLEWTSNNPVLVVNAPSGGKVVVTVNRPAYGEVSVVLTVKATLNDVTSTKKYTVVVLGLQEAVEVNEDTMAAFQRNLSLPERISSNLNLVKELSQGVTVSWSSSNEDVLKADGKVTRPAGNGVGVKLVATITADTEDGTTIQKVREFFVFVYGKNINVNGSYNTAFGEIVTLNPLMSTGSADSDVYDFLIDSLYHDDYNWARAIKDGNAAYPGDFSKFRDRNAPVDPNDGLLEMPYLSRIYTLGMAAEFPYAVNLGKNFDLGFGELDEKGAKENQDSEWIIKLRKDLVFADGRAIDAHVFEYSFKQYLDGKQLNERANYLYNKDYIPLVNGEAYFKQGTPIPNDPYNALYPEVTWDTVGFDLIDDYTFKISLTGKKSQWHVMTYLGILCLVHPEKFEAGFNPDRTITKYGSVTNIPVSYGPYVLSSWEEDVKFTFTRNERYFKAYDYTIQTINGPIVKDQKDRINEFKAGKLDAAGVGGEFWKEFMDHPNLYVSPSNSFYRLAISLDRSKGTSGKTASPILLQKEFRRALYLATDRLDFCNEVQPPSEPALGFLSNIHQVTEWALGAYEKSPVALHQLQELGLSPSTGGYNINEARALFASAYAAAVAEGKYTAGEKVVVEFSYYDAGSNIKIANWVKAQYEKVFNKTVKFEDQDVEFEINLDPMNSAQFTAARDAGDFDMCFTGMSGATFQATFGMGYIFSRTYSTFLVGRGHDTGNLPVTAEMVNLFDILSDKNPEELLAHEAAFLAAVDKNGVYSGTFDDLFDLWGDTPNFDLDYLGQEEDLTNITAALERALLDQVTAVPLFSATSASVFAPKVLRVAPAYSLFMGWGGMRYTHIKVTF